jgi:RimJ/RimL family protein N-acetyltransferase
VEVRKATLEDATAAAEILAAIAPEDLIATEPPVDVAARALRFRETIESDGRDCLWLLLDGDEVVGNAGAHEGPDGVLALGMGILPSHRGRGGGRLLMAVIIEHAERCGAHKLELEVWPDNERAIALYESHGFEVEGIRRNHYRRRDGSLRSAVLMARPVGQG